MKQRNSAKGKIKGLYLRGNIFWLTHGSGKSRIQMSLETSDEIVAIEKARKVVADPELCPTSGFKAEVLAYADERYARGHWTENSRSSKLVVLQKFGEALENPEPTEVTTPAIQKWYDAEVERVKASANSYLSTVHAFFECLVAKHKRRDNPAEGVERVTDERRARERFTEYREREEIIKKAKDPDLKFILYCGFYGGFRKNEIIEARSDWFDLDRDLIHVKKTQTFNPKNKKDRTIPLHPEFKRFLEEYGKHDPYMLAPSVEKGKARYRYDFRKPYDQYMANIGFKWVHPHIMRHSFASLLASAGCSLYKIAKWLGDLGDTLRALASSRRGHRAPHRSKAQTQKGKRRAGLGRR